MKTSVNETDELKIIQIDHNPCYSELIIIRKQPKEILDKLNALKSELASLKTAKLSKHVDAARIQELEEEIKKLKEE